MQDSQQEPPTKLPPAMRAKSYTSLVSTMPSETDIFMSLFYMLAGSLLVGVFSQGMRALTWASKYTCTTGDNTCKVLRDVAMRVRVFFSDVLAVKDLEKGVGGGIQVVVLVGILIVLVSLLRTASADAKPKTVVR